MLIIFTIISSLLFKIKFVFVVPILDTTFLFFWQSIIAVILKSIFMVNTTFNLFICILFRNFVFIKFIYKNNLSTSAFEWGIVKKFRTKFTRSSKGFSPILSRIDATSFSKQWCIWFFFFHWMYLFPLEVYFCSSFFVLHENFCQRYNTWFNCIKAFINIKHWQILWNRNITR